MWTNKSGIVVLIAVLTLNTTGCLFKKKGEGQGGAAAAEEEKKAAGTCSIEEEAATPFASGNGTAGSPYRICTAAQLEQVRNYSSAEFELASDVDLSGVTFAPIASFAGTFNGGGKTISNFSVSASSGSTGLFAVVNAGAVVKNLALSNALISLNGTSGNSGVLAGDSAGLIENCSSSGTVTGVFSDNSQFSQAAGGLVGLNNLGGVIRGSHSSAAVTGTGNYANPGGLVGINLQGTVEKSYALGAVATGATAYNTGGLIGWNYSGTVTDSYARGSVTSNSGGNYAGGLIGWNFPMGTNVARTYATGAVTGIGGRGGLIYNSQQTLEVVDSHYDTQTTGTVSSPGGGVGHSTVGMQDVSTYAGWDNTTVWTIVPASYPELK